MRKDIWICIEKGKNNCSAYAPAVPGCISTGRTVEDTKKSMEEALSLHFEGMVEDGASLDGIVSEFPAEIARSAGDDEEYFALAHVEIAQSMVSAEA